MKQVEKETVKKKWNKGWLVKAKQNKKAWNQFSQVRYNVTAIYIHLKCYGSRNSIEFCRNFRCICMPVTRTVGRMPMVLWLEDAESLLCSFEFCAGCSVPVLVSLGRNSGYEQRLRKTQGSTYKRNNYQGPFERFNLGFLPNSITDKFCGYPSHSQSCHEKLKKNKICQHMNVRAYMEYDNFF